MNKIIITLFALTAVLSLVALKPTAAPSTVLMDAREDSLVADRAKYTKEILESIKGKEKMAADSVFKNVKIFKGKPAEQLLRVMETGWSKALGVGCNHCHNVKDFAEEKGDYKIAVEMVAMTNTINEDLIKKMKSYAGRQRVPTVNCSTCHRGESHPGRPNRTGPGGPPQRAPR